MEQSPLRPLDYATPDLNRARLRRAWDYLSGNFYEGLDSLMNSLGYLVGLLGGPRRVGLVLGLLLFVDGAICP